MVKCSVCGAEVEPGANFCPKCGARVPLVEEEKHLKYEIKYKPSYSLGDSVAV